MTGWGQGSWGDDYWGFLGEIPEIETPEPNVPLGWGQGGWGNYSWGFLTPPVEYTPSIPPASIVGWGLGAWGLDSWGYGEPVESLLENEGPIIIRRYPFPGQVDVLEDVTMSVSIFDGTFDLNPGTIRIFLDGLEVYTGSSGFVDGYIGRVTYSAGIYTVQFTKIGGFEFEQVVQMRALAADNTGLFVDNTWVFTVRDNPVCYTGLNALPIETAIQTPFTIFTGLEFYRNLFLNNALQVQTRSTKNAGNKAARVLYQTAFATELSTLLNPYQLKDETALTVNVCEKRRLLYLNNKLNQQGTGLRAAASNLAATTGLGDAYQRAFHDYLDSSLYIYRISLLANMLLFAKAYELQQP